MWLQAWITNGQACHEGRLPRALNQIIPHIPRYISHRRYAALNISRLIFSPRDTKCYRESARKIVNSSQSGTKHVRVFYRHVWQKSFADANAAKAPEDKVQGETYIEHLSFLSELYREKEASVLVNLNPIRILSRNSQRLSPRCIRLCSGDPHGGVRNRSFINDAVKGQHFHSPKEVDRFV